ncbi:SDR family NAD(P)-dependent oxidoreductase [Blastococcus sp. VKM Ac-2987]|uniref:SDR family NAD(P)-dependent oxidoreductase n=1 Tax=Blastococcus sp. VKM Ac-2987 TaxID=3004141 RepID=UPI0022ABB0B1|nr:SDR family NAD(P)-dependent oxidoreductase [Blastococcus sp. VKM Ac-2987]MCZ2860396.1 SDR family NAD(P)-dependent oxidoreductase [Blastococcus sp. VKM Ac-2987]
MGPYAFAGGTAVVTGAASGIGEALAGQLAGRGSHLVLLDRDAERLDGVAGRIRADHPALRVATHVVDLADDEATARVAARLVAEHPETTLLVNNAGVALGGRFDQVTLEEFEWVMAINVRAVVRLTHTLLPVLKAHPGAHVVNVSSVFGIFAPAGQAAYAASKFAVRGFSEALRHELADDGIGVTVVHPGGIRTRIAESARTGSGVSVEEYEEGRRQFAKLLRMPPEDAAAQIVAAIERRRPRLLIGWTATVPDVLVRLLPGTYWRLMARRAAPAKPKGAA